MLTFHYRHIRTQTNKYEFPNKILYYIFLNSFRVDCYHFELESVEFPLLDELETDIATFETMWKLYEEFNTDLEELSKQDWISFR